jgi:hypothetical protein
LKYVEVLGVLEPAARERNLIAGSLPVRTLDVRVVYFEVGLLKLIQNFGVGLSAPTCIKRINPILP